MKCKCIFSGKKNKKIYFKMSSTVFTIYFRTPLMFGHHLFSAKYDNLMHHNSSDTP